MVGINDGSLLSKLKGELSVGAWEGYFEGAADGCVLGVNDGDKDGSSLGF